MMSLVITGTRQVQYKYNPGDEQWQRNACSTLGLVYVGPNRVTPGGPDIDLKPPNGFKGIEGDGNCLFRTFSFILTGSKMDKSGIWGTETEMLALAHMLQTDIYSYNTDDHKWHKYGIADLDRTVSDNVTHTSIYMHHPYNHFEVVQSIEA